MVAARTAAQSAFQRTPRYSSGRCHRASCAGADGRWRCAALASQPPPSRGGPAPSTSGPPRLAEKAPAAAAKCAAGPAEVILRGGKVHTVDEAFSTAEAVAVRGGRFVAVGDNDSVLTHAGPDTDIIDLRGKAAVPGLIDSHLHQIYVALNIRAVDLLDARSIADVQGKIADRAAATPSGEWVVASSGWHESILAEGHLPTRWELDEAAPANPVIVPRGASAA